MHYSMFLSCTSWHQSHKMSRYFLRFAHCKWCRFMRRMYCNTNHIMVYIFLLCFLLSIFLSFVCRLFSYFSFEMNCFALDIICLRLLTCHWRQCFLLLLCVRISFVSPYSTAYDFYFVSFTMFTIHLSHGPNNGILSLICTHRLTGFYVFAVEWK